MNNGKIYVVCWGSASQDGEGNCSAYTGVHGVYTELKKAQQGLEDCKNEMYDEIVNDPDFDEEERQDVENSTEVYGSVKENYFEIDYDSWDIRNEIHITLVEQELK